MNASATHSARARPKIHLRPTRSCFLLCGVLLAMWLAAVNYENNLSYLVLAVVGSVALVSSVHTRHNLTRLEVFVLHAHPIFAQENGGIGLSVRNHRSDDACSIVLDHPILSLNPQPVRLARVPRRSLEAAEWLIHAPWRGRYWISEIRVSSVFPLGLFRAWFWQPLGAEFLVYPKPRGARSWTESVGEEDFSPAAKPRKDGSDFHGLKSYSPGDSQRHIHWKTVARGGPLLVKEFAGGDMTHLYFDWSGLDGLGHEDRLEQIAFWILKADREGLAYGLRLPGFSCAPARGIAHKHACLRQLAIFGSVAL